MRAAIVVGCRSYDDDQIADLKYADRDAELIGNSLKMRCGVAEENLYVIAGRDRPGERIPTRSEFIRVLAKGPEIAARQSIETLFLFFSGHGCHSIRTGKDYLVLADTLHNALEETALNVDLIEFYLRRWRAERTVIIMDACRSHFEEGKSHQALATTQDLQLMNVEGMIVLRSCSPGERSYEIDDQKCGLFTSSLLEGLSDSGKCTTYYELDQFLYNAIPKLCRVYDKPLHYPVMRVEPATALGANLVSAEQAIAWRRERPLGQEIRTVSIRRNDDGGPWSDFIGIDFGTTSCLVSVFSKRSGLSQLVEVNASKHIPTAISFRSDLSYVVGRDAKAELVANGANALAYFKRSLGSGEAFNIGGRSITSEQAACLIIKSLKRSAEDFTGVIAKRVLASYPVNFSNTQFNGLSEAFMQAGFEIIRFVPEPCAAALTLTASWQNDQKVAIVIDLGGGTFDIAGLMMDEHVIEILVVDGDRNIGGRDYDKLLANSFRDEAISLGIDECFLDDKLIMAEAERCKILLSDIPIVPVLIDLGESADGAKIDLKIVVTREKAAGLFSELDNKIMKIVTNLKQSLLSKILYHGNSNIDSIIIAGVGAKLFSLRQKIENEFYGIEIIDRYQENAVAFGTAVYLKTLEHDHQETASSWLMLNVAGKELSIQYAEELRIVDDDEKRSEFGNKLLYVSDRHDYNRHKMILIESDTTIPTKKDAN